MLREEGDEENRPFIGRWPRDRHLGAENRRARGLYESEGFVAEGVMRDSFWTGEEYESLEVMSLLESEYGS